MCLVLYGSATGNAADLADTLHDRLRRRSLPRVAVMPLGETSVAEIAAHRHVFIICATTGQGALPPNTQPLWVSLLQKKLQEPFANTQLYAFGLGSSAYPRFNWAIRKVAARFVQLGATLAVPRGEGDDIGAQAYEVVFEEWLKEALEMLDKDLGVQKVLGLDELLPPISRIAFSPSKAAIDRSDQTAVALSLKELCLRQISLHQLTKADETNATIVVNERITAPSHFQDVRRVVVELDTPQELEPGDVLKLWPTNDPTAVDAVIAAQKWDPDSVMSVESDVRSLRGHLLHTFDLNAIPRRGFFVVAQHFCREPRHAERMREFASDLDDFFDYTTRPRRSIAEVVLEFDSLEIPLEYLGDLLPRLWPRQYSIASRPTEAEPFEVIEISTETADSQSDPTASTKDTNKDIASTDTASSGTPTITEHATAVSDTALVSSVTLAVAVVKYRTALRRVRRGVCTRWLETAPDNLRVRAETQRSGLQLSRRAAMRPVILVATGTGIAPIRSWAFRRSWTQPAVLFFGCRNEDDFLFKGELGNTTVVPAFSRPSDGPKQYVQDAILAYDALPVETALIVVCGSSGDMPRAVREAFVVRLQREGRSWDEAERVMDKKDKDGTYIQETW